MRNNRDNKELFNVSETELQSRFEKEEAYIRAQKKVKKIKGFYIHLLIYILVNIFLISTIKSRTDLLFWSFGTFSTAIFWGIGIAFHFMGTFGVDKIFGHNWEQRQIEKYMEDDKNRKRWE